MHNYYTADNNSHNVPQPRRRQHQYDPSDLVELVGQPTRRPASMREAVPFINVPGPGQTWQQLNQWREAYGLRSVTR